MAFWASVLVAAIARMIESFYQFLHGSTPAEFKSAFGLQESVERLRAATERSVWSALAQPAAVGPVKETKVRLQRVIPMVHNSFKPDFFGRFEVRPDGVYLSGRFTMPPFVKIFMTFWLGTAILFGIVAAIGVQAQHGSLLAPFVCFGMAGFGIGLIAFAKWLARNDPAWLSAVICSALAVPGRPEAAATISTISVEEGTPTVLRVAAGVVAIGGVVNLLSVSTNWMPNGAGGPLLGEPVLRTAIRLMSVAMIGLAIGIYQRRLLAWRLGFAFLAATTALGPLQIFLFTTVPQPLGIKIGASVAALVVWGLWTRWWYAQRTHFV